MKALDQLDEVIALIRRSPEVDDARQGLIALLDIDDVQADAILNMQLRRLAALERQRIIDELAKQLKIPDTVTIGRDIKETGNTSAASVPLAMHRVLEEDPSLSGGLALQIGFGAGLVYGAQVVRLP